jgi:hypothetical protein
MALFGVNRAEFKKMLELLEKAVTMFEKHVEEDSEEKIAIELLSLYNRLVKAGKFAKGVGDMGVITEVSGAAFEVYELAKLAEQKKLTIIRLRERLSVAAKSLRDAASGV